MAIFTQTRVDYMGIIEALLQGTNESYERNKEVMNWGDHAVTLRDCRTVGFLTGRQTGKGEFIADFYRKYPNDTSVLVRDAKLQSVARANILKGADGPTPHVSGPVAVATVIKSHMADVTAVPESVSDDPLNRRYIIVDDATFFFDMLHSMGIKRNNFFRAIASRRGTDVNIILIG
jgi:hypothetical protein